MNLKERAEILTVAILGLSLLLLCNGCGRDPQEQKALTQQSANEPQYVLTMPDGRNLYCITIAKESETYDHYVYFFSTNDLTTVSINRNLRVGKVTFNQTIVIDGVTYQAISTNK